jgi:hypothetical protein
VTDQDKPNSRPKRRLRTADIVSNVVGLARMSPSISSDDAVDLRWYFSVHGAAVLDHSSIGAQLQRAELYYRCATPCTRCGGDIERDVPGCGFVAEQSTRTPSQRQRDIAALLDIYAEEIPPAPDRPCPECGCTGWSLRITRSNAHRPLTARPTGSSVQERLGVQVSDANVHRLGITTRRLQRAADLAPMAVDVLQLFYGPSRADGGGGMLALWELTGPGRSMLRGNSLGLDPARYFANLRAEQEQKRNPNRARQFREADKQAGELLTMAIKVWNLACGHHPAEVA